MVQRSGHSTCGYHGWSPWRTCHSFPVMGRGSTQEPPCLILHVGFLHVYCMADAAIYFGLVPILFDVDSGHEGHSGELPLFEGYYVGRRLICFSSSLHVYRTQFLMDLFKDPICLVCVCVYVPWDIGADEIAPKSFAARDLSTVQLEFTNVFCIRLSSRSAFSLGWWTTDY